MATSSAFERLGLMREWLVDMSSLASDLDDPTFSKALARMQQANLTAGDRLAQMLQEARTGKAA